MEKSANPGVDNDSLAGAEHLARPLSSPEDAKLISAPFFMRGNKIFTQIIY
jgi:hypothetical protein